MSDIDSSDQIESQEDDFEFEQGDEVTDEADSESESEESGEEGEGSEGSEKVQAKKSGYVEFTPEQQARVNDITRKRHDAERRAQAAERELAKYKKPPEPPKEVPQPTADPVTDQDLFLRQQQEREKYIRDKAIFDANEQASQQQKQAALEKRRNDLADVYNKNAERLGVNPRVLAEAAQKLVGMGIPDALSELLLEDDDGPAITAYLGANPDDAETLLSLPAVKVGSFIERHIRSKLKPKQISKAPSPPTKVSGTRPSKGVESDGTLYE